ncbi:MAG: PEP-CTERM sorting domain-containing protein [Verrucomicrobia bacterium]|nr:PEP-CTERM sorting domain-containing protein [Verrucomicrobiota bacterium]MCH8525608.1 PEP-CTERM sorting domain-containing protein [Kiritimatiellia bacterium]
MITNKRLLFAALTAAALPFAAQALTIGFESGEGYAAGDLAGQPSSGTQWVNTFGAVNVVNVAAGVGNGGGAGLVNTSTGGGSNFVFYGFNTTNADLGFTFDSTSSVLQYSFDWRPTQDLNGSNGQILFDFMVGSNADTGTDAAMALRIHSSGRFQANDGGTLRTVDGLFGTAGTYSTISGTINYATNQFTVFVDNTQLFTTNNNGNLGFQNTASDNAYIRFSNLRGGTDSAQWREWNMDNISVIPEPSTLALVGIALGSMVFLRRRKN